MLSFRLEQAATGASRPSTTEQRDFTFPSVDFSAAALNIVLQTTLSNPAWNAAPFNGIVFTAANMLGIAIATVDPATTMAGFDNSRVSFSANQILFDWNGLSYSDGTIVQVDFTFTPAVVPEPASVALLGSGLLGLGVVARRRGRSS